MNDSDCPSSGDKSEKLVLVVKFVLVINFNAVQSWVFDCSPWQHCAVKAKVMMNMFALVVFIRFQWELLNLVEQPCPIHSSLGVSGDWVVGVAALVFMSMYSCCAMITSSLGVHVRLS